MADIKLPPLPVPTLIADSPAGHTAAYSPAQLRARDIEVAKAVLQTTLADSRAYVDRLKERIDAVMVENAALREQVRELEEAQAYVIDQCDMRSEQIRALRAELEEWRFTNRVDELDRHVTRLAEQVRVLRDVLWVLAEHNELHFGKSHNTVIQARAALEAK